MRGYLPKAGRSDPHLSSISFEAFLITLGLLHGPRDCCQLQHLAPSPVANFGVFLQSLSQKTHAAAFLAYALIHILQHIDAQSS